MTDEATTAGVADQMAALARRQEQVEAEVAALRAENEALRRAPRVETAPSRPSVELMGPARGTDDQVVDDRTVGRRHLLRSGMAAAGAAAVAAAGGALLVPGTAAAATGDPLALGSVTNTTPDPTALVATGSTSYGFGVFDAAPMTTEAGRPAVLAQASGAAFSTAIGADARGATSTGLRVVSGGQGVNIRAGTDIPRTPRGDGGTAVRVDGVGIQGALITSDDGYAVYASSTKAEGLIAAGTQGIVAFGSSTSVDEPAIEGVAWESIGVRGRSYGTHGGGGRFSGRGFNLLLDEEPSSVRTAPTGDPFAHLKGELVETTAGDLWLCVVGGTPGTWRKLGGPATAGAFHVLPSPVRVYDSRAGTAPSTGPKTRLGGATNRTVDLKGNNSAVPAGATAAMVNVLLVDASSGNGNFTIWANGVARPSGNTLVWGGSTGRFSTLAVTGLDAQGQCQLNASLLTNVVVDVVGYYR